MVRGEKFLKIVKIQNAFRYMKQYIKLLLSFRLFINTTDQESRTACFAIMLVESNVENGNDSVTNSYNKQYPLDT